MIRVAYATSARYLPWAATSLHSLLKTHEPGSLEVHVLHASELTADDEATLERMCAARDCAAIVHRVDPSLTVHYPSVGYFTRTVWLPFLLPDLLSDAARVLYVDADTLVVDRLDDLWATDIGDAPLAAIRNVVEPAARSHLSAIGLADHRKYLNSGIILYNLDVLRADGGLWAALIALVAARGDELKWADQDALNLLFEGRWVPLHPRWNVMNSLWDWRDWACEVHGTEAVDQAIARPAILHFEGPSTNKPWHYLSSHPWRAVYRRTLAETPWGSVELEGRTTAARAAALVPRRWRMRAFIELARVERKLASLGRDRGG